MRGRFFALAAVAALALGAAPAKANLIVNGGFETGNLSGWTRSGVLNNTTASGLNDGVAPHSGSFQAALGPIGGDGVMSQSFSDTAGQSLQIEFFLAAGGSCCGTTPNDFHAKFNGTSLLDIVNDGAQAYTDYIFTVTATGSDKLEFDFRHDPAFFFLDDVSVNVVAVTEPATLALFASALLGLGWAKRRRDRG